MAFNINYKKPKKSDYSKLFALFIFATAAVVFATIEMSAAAQDESGLYWIAILPLIPGTIIILSVFVHVALNFINKK